MEVRLERERYHFGGYLVTQRVPRQTWMSDALLPSDILTASGCIARFEDGRFGWPNVVLSSEVLAELMRLLPRERDWVVMGLGLREDHARAFLEENAPGEGVGVPGVYAMIARRCPLPAGGTVLGCEPLGIEHADAHSWLCNGLERACFEALGLRPNPAGFLQTEADADRAHAYISSGEVGAEPVLWLPWWIVDYTREATRLAEEAR